jgi:hypothetical protein
MTKFAFIILISLILKEYIALEVIYRKSIQDNFQSNKDYNGRLARPLRRTTAKHGHDYSCNPSFTNFLFLCAGVINTLCRHYRPKADCHKAVTTIMSCPDPH